MNICTLKPNKTDLKIQLTTYRITHTLFVHMKAEEPLSAVKAVDDARTILILTSYGKRIWKGPT